MIGGLLVTNYSTTLANRDRGRLISSGFSLVELMVTVAIASILMSVAGPTLITSIKSNRLTAQINSVSASLFITRSEAVKQSTNTLVMCASTDSVSCDTNNWENGWIIFIDADADNTLDVAEELVKVVTPLEGDNKLRTSGFTNLGHLTFDKNGMPDSSGTFTLCDDRGVTFAKAAILSIVGHTRLGVDEDTVPDEIVNVDSGASGGVNVICP